MKSFKIITADRNGGKTTRIKELISKDNKSFGFISEKSDSGYSLVSTETGEDRLYLSRNPIFDDTFFSWYIDNSAFDWVYDLILKAGERNFYLDEIGRLELLERGYAKSLRYLMKMNVDITIAVRNAFLSDVLQHFSIKDFTVDEVKF